MERCCHPGKTSRPRLKASFFLSHQRTLKFLRITCLGCKLRLRPHRRWLEAVSKHWKPSARKLHRCSENSSHCLREWTMPAPKLLLRARNFCKRWQTQIN